MKLKTGFSKVIVLMLAFLLVMGRTLTFANDESTEKELILSYYRYVNGEKKYAYKYSTADTNGQEGTTGKKIFQIMTEDKTKTNYYCLNATVGASWTGDGATLNEEHPAKATYNSSFDLNNTKDLKRLRENETTDIRDVYKNVAKSTYFNQIWWILDNMYVPNTEKASGETDQDLQEKNKNQKQELLANAGLAYVHPIETDINGNLIDNSNKYTYKYEKQTGYDDYSTKLKNLGYTNLEIKNGWFYYDVNGTYKTIELSDELIEVAGQAALWYFTNQLDNNSNNSRVYDVKEQGLKLSYSENANTWVNMANAFEENTDVEGYKAKTGMWQEEQATILCWYLIDAANKYDESVKNGTVQMGNPLIISNSAQLNEKTVGENQYEVFGPIKIEEKGTSVYTLENSFTITVDGVEKTNTDAYISDANGNQGEQELSKNINKDFYIAIPKSTVGNGSRVEIDFKGKYKTNSKVLWANKTADEQPVVEVTPDEEPIKLKINATREDNRKFDLALRKQIVKLTDSKGKEKSISNEAGKSAVRRLSYETSTIAGPDTTATYKHRKDPVVVEKGDVVTYKISIYNEGEMAGYAKEIVDKLPEGLTINGSATGTFTKGNVSYSYSYDATTNSVKFTNQSKNVLTPFNGGDTLSSEEIEIECKVDKAPTTVSTYLTNIAYISKSFNTETNEDVVKDRDSSTNNSPSKNQVTTGDKYTGYHGGNNHNVENNKNVYNDGTNNDDYFPGMEDDDDFEVVVIKPAEFDLALQKYITSVYSKGKTKAGRQEPTIDTTSLADKTATTAKYTQDKTPIKVKHGDYVTYTFTVYNEGEIDGYVKKITDNIPEGVEFVYQKDNDGKTLITCDSEGNSSEIEVEKEIYDLVGINSFWSIDKEENKIKKDTYNGKSTTSVTCDVESAIPPMVGSTQSNAGGHLTAYDSSKDVNHNGDVLDRLSVTVVYRVTAPNAKGIIIRNEAAITGATDVDGNVQDAPDSHLKDRDSQVTNWKGKDGDKNYQDDEDFDNIILGKVDLALTKFIVAISDDMKFEDGEYLTKDTTSKNAGKASNPYTRQTAVDTTPLKQGGHDAIYTQNKTDLTIPEESYVLYNIRVYNEGEVDVFAGEVADYLPNYLDYVSCDFNDNFGWKVEKDGKTVRTSYLAYTENKDKILKAFDKEKDDGKGSKLDYKDLQILCRVNTKAPENTKLINTAEITKYQDEDGDNLEEDIDSKPGNVPEKNVEKRVEDDDDYDYVLIKKKKVDIALSKFIAAISQDTTIEDGEYVTADGKVGSKENPYLRATKVDTTPLKNGEHDAIYTKDKTPIVVPAESYVLYDIRVYNEGEVDLYAGEVTDYLPVNLDYVSCEFNDKFGWKVGEDGKTIKTTYLSFANGEQNLLNAFDKVNDDGAGSGLDYRDLQILCRVSKDAPSNTNIVNVAEITKYEDDGGKPISEDIDSTPDNVDKQNEDDDDYEVVLVKTFDLALLKWVSTVYVTEDGVTKTTETGNTGDDSKDIIPKVEINRKKLNSTVVKFGYTIKITNEGDIAGAATEITDYVPQGLKFYKEDNQGWEEKSDGVITTRLLENTILEPGESAEVKVVFRWINGANNLGLKTNIAEISEDFNKEGIPDKDSTPGNKVWGEDDIDDAQVLLSISTGLVGHIVMYATFGLVILIVLGGGIIGIKKFVL